MSEKVFQTIRPERAFISIKKELMSNLKEINDRLYINQMSLDTRASLLLAKTQTLHALQKYEIGGELD